MLTTDPTETDETGRRLLRLTLDNTIISCLANQVLSLLVVILLWPLASRLLLTGWLVTMTLIVAARLVIYYQPDTNDEKQGRPYCALVVANAIAWAGFTLVFFPEDAPQHQMAITFILAGITAGAIPTLAPLIRIYLAFSSIILLTLAVRLLIFHSPIFYILAGGSILYLLIISLAAKKMHTVLSESIQLQLREEAMNQKLTEEVEQRRHTEIQLQIAMEKACKANRAKSEFLANMSHELRTPLNGILGYCDILLEGNLDYGQRQGLNTIKDCGESLLGLLNDLLDLIKIEAQEIELNIVTMDISDIVYGVNELMRSRLSGKPIELLVDMDDLPTSVMGDPLRLRQVLMNIVGNAVKFTEKGHIISTVRVLHQTASAIEIEISVTDTGIGMTGAQTSVVFDAFSQADGSVTRKYGGTGVGLTISRQLVRAMGGELQVNSVLHKGSTFSFRLSFKKATAPQPKDVFQIPADWQQKSVVILDDNLVALEITKWQLIRLGLMVDAFSKQTEALDFILKKKGVDLLVLDILMPGMDGFAFLAKVRSHFPSLKVIALTADLRTTTGDRIRQTGIDALLLKPAKASAVASAIRSVFQPAEQKKDQPETLQNASSNRAEHTVVQPLNILMAEDNKVNQAMQHKIISNLGHKVTVVENGAAAVDMVSRQHFDLVLMDMQMPVMSGLDATAAIRSQGIDIPILALTANAFDSDRQACKEAGMNDFLAKPIDREALQDKLRSFFPGHYTASS